MHSLLFYYFAHFCPCSFYTLYMWQHRWFVIGYRPCCLAVCSAIEDPAELHLKALMEGFLSAELGNLERAKEVSVDMYM